MNTRVCTTCYKTSEEVYFTPSAIRLSKRKAKCASCNTEKVKARYRGGDIIETSKVYKYIYGLVDPSNNSVFYIGSSVDPTERLKTHINKARGCYNQQPLTETFIREILADGLRPTYILLEDLVLDWEAKEIEYIRRWNSSVILTNHHIGTQIIQNQETNS